MTEDIEGLRLRLQVVSDEGAPAEPGEETAATLRLLGAVEEAGAQAVPIYDGQRGGSLYEILTGVLVVLQTHEVLVETVKMVQPMLARMMRVGGRAGGSRVKLSLEVGATRLALEADDVETAERMMRVAESFAAALTADAPKELTIRAEIASTEAVP